MQAKFLLQFLRLVFEIYRSSCEVFHLLWNENIAVACAKHFPDIDETSFVTGRYRVFIGLELDPDSKRQAIGRTLARLVGWLHCNILQAHSSRPQPDPTLLAIP